MSIKKYEVLLQTADLGSFTKASEVLGYTQSAISHIVTGLEDELGLKLLTRDRFGVRLTPEGEALLPAIRAVCQQNQEVTRQAAQFHGLEIGQVRIGTFLSVSVHILPDLLHTFSQRHPNITFELLQGSYEDIERWLSEGRIDLGFLRLPTNSHFECTLLLEERILAIFPEDQAPEEEVAGWLFWGFWTSPDQRLAGVIDASVSLPVQLFPVGGWLGWVFSACLGLGTWWPGLLLCLAWFFLLLFLLTHFDRDWYEDVLRTAELAQSAIVAKKEGTMESVPGKVRIGATGLKKGWGASAFYYKHKIENRRGSWMLLPPASLIFAVVLIGFSFFMRESGILPVFAFAVYLQLFTAGQSRINRELYKPFIYLVPESSFSKLLHCLRELVPSALAEAIVVFVPVGLILGMGPGAILVCLFARMSYALLFQSGNLLLERFWSGASKALIMFLYFLILILLTLPGILIAVFLMVLLNLPGGVSGGLLVAGIINIPVALLLLYLLRDMLQYAEYNR